ncbi:MAG: LamG domain-containing protein, partial [Planctomycetes bacterium]|nr:LamG domain-containing protein [Planctomycetota bacterium]
MTESFDPYYRWLGIPPKDQPPNYYRLLGIEIFEDERDVIDAAANRIMAYLKDLAVGDDTGLSQPLLNEIAQARICLLNKKKKAAYDQQLRAELANAEPARPAPPSTPAPPTAPAHASAPVTAAPISLVTVASADKPHRRPQRSSPLPLIAGAIALAFAAVLIATLSFILLSGRGTRKAGSGQLADRTRPRQSVSPASGSGMSERKPSMRGDTWPPPTSDLPDLPVDRTADQVQGGARPPTTEGAVPATGTESDPAANSRPGELEIDAPTCVLDFSGPRQSVVLRGTRQIASANREFTAEMWTRFPPVDQNQELMGTFVPRGIFPNHPDASGWDVSLTVSAANRIGLAMRYGGSREPNGSSVSGYCDAPLEGWHHVAVAKNQQGLLSGFIDGNRIWRSAWTGGADPELSDLRLGAAPNWGSEGLHGLVRAFRLSRVCRYPDSFPKPDRYTFENDAETVVLLDFSRPQAGIVGDLSGNDHIGQLVNVNWAE